MTKVSARVRAMKFAFCRGCFFFWLAALGRVCGQSRSPLARRFKMDLFDMKLRGGISHQRNKQEQEHLKEFRHISHKLSTNVIVSLALSLVVASGGSAFAASDLGASDTSNTKIQKGGASTLQAGIAKTITRGVNLDKSDFSNQNLKGVAFQQSIVRDASFKNSNLYSASFFDATLDGTDFENADMTLANIELAQFNRANMKNTIAREMYVVGATNFDGITSIENSDWSDTDLSRAQRKYLCGLVSARGTNSKTGTDTRESLLCE